MEFKDYYATLGVEPARARPKSRPPTVGWHASTTRTSARKPAPRTSSRPSTRPTRRCAIPKARGYDQLRAQGYRPGEERNLPPAGGRGLVAISEEVFGGGGGGPNGGF